MFNKLSRTALRQQSTAPALKNASASPLVYSDPAFPLPTTVDKNSARFQENHDQLKELCDELHKKIQTNALGGGERARNLHISRNKLLPRDRIIGRRSGHKTFLGDL